MPAPMDTHDIKTYFILLQNIHSHSLIHSIIHSLSFDLSITPFSITSFLSVTQLSILYFSMVKRPLVDTFTGESLYRHCLTVEANVIPTLKRPCRKSESTKRDLAIEYFQEQVGRVLNHPVHTNSTGDNLVGLKYLQDLVDSKPKCTSDRKNNGGCTIPFNHLTTVIALTVSKMTLSRLRIDWTVMPDKCAEFSKLFPKHLDKGEFEIDIAKSIHHSKVCFLIQVC
jgi:hypothetical protein